MAELTKLLQRFSTLESYGWVPITSLQDSEYLACIDGRTHECLIAAPGGDLGEFSVLLTALENELGRTFDAREIENMLTTVVEAHGTFYMHTDSGALEVLEQTLLEDDRVSGLLDGAIDPFELCKNCPEELRQILAQYLTMPRHTGCGFLALLLDEPDAMLVRRELVEVLILAFYSKVWADSPHVRLTVLEGSHQEDAVLVIDFEASHEVTASTQIPTFCGEHGHPSNLFIDHRPARQFLRRQNLTLLMERHTLEVDAELVLNRAEEIASLQMTAVLNALAADLPRYHVVFDKPESQPVVTPLN